MNFNMERILTWNEFYTPQNFPQRDVPVVLAISFLKPATICLPASTISIDIIILTKPGYEKFGFLRPDESLLIDEYTPVSY